MGFWVGILMMLGVVGLMFLAMRIIPGPRGTGYEFAPKSRVGGLISIAAIMILVVLMAVATYLRK